MLRQGMYTQASNAQHAEQRLRQAKPQQWMAILHNISLDHSGQRPRGRGGRSAPCNQQSMMAEQEGGEGRTYNVNVGVLGHVDSGKTSLVAALSTILSTAALDKHPQSRERGITLDLGFSSFTVWLESVPCIGTCA